MLFRWLFTVLTVFRLAKTISLETEVGAREFPEYLQQKIEVTPGYRPKITLHGVPPENPGLAAHAEAAAPNLR